MIRTSERSIAAVLTCLLILGFSLTANSADLVLDADEVVLIESEAGQQRVLISFASAEALQGKKILYARLVVAAEPDSCESSFIEIEISALTRSWSAVSASWTEPWDSAGGDYAPTFSRGSIARGGSGSSAILTDMVQGWANGTLENDGLILISRSDECSVALTAGSPVDVARIEVRYVDHAP